MVRHVAHMREEKISHNREQEIGCLEDLDIDVRVVLKYCLIGMVRIHIEEYMDNKLSPVNMVMELQVL